MVWYWSWPWFSPSCSALEKCSNNILYLIPTIYYKIFRKISWSMSFKFLSWVSFEYIFQHKIVKSNTRKNWIQTMNKFKFDPGAPAAGQGGNFRVSRFILRDTEVIPTNAFSKNSGQRFLTTSILQKKIKWQIRSWFKMIEGMFFFNFQQPWTLYLYFEKNKILSNPKFSLKYAGNLSCM